MEIEIDEITQEIEQKTNDQISEMNKIETIEQVSVAFGGIAAFGAMARFASSATIKLLQNIRDKEQYKVFGFNDFTSFLDKSPLAKKFCGFTYRTFNRLENQLEAEGQEVFDLLNEMKIPMTERKQLGTGDVQIEGDKIFIGEEETSVEDMPTIKGLIKSLANENRELRDGSDKKESKIETLEKEKKIGQDDYEQLKRNFEEFKNGDDFDRAVGTAANALIKLNDQAKNLSDDDKEKRGENVLDSLWKLINITRDELGQTNFIFQDLTGSAVDSDLQKAVAATGDWDD